MKVIAEKFARLLDNNQFDDAMALLSDDCRYHYDEGDYSGSKNIIGLYRINHEQAKQTFDEVLYSSSVEPLSENTVKVIFIDNIRMGKSWHTYQCYQILRITGELIEDVQHHEIPGEMEALRVFYNRARTLMSIHGENFSS
jgi:hypothetical protein